MIKILILIVVLFLLNSTCLSAGEDNKNNTNDFNSYQIISAGTGNKYNLEAFKEVEIIKKNAVIISNIKELLLEKDIDISQIDISIYLDELATDSSLPKNKIKNIVDSHIISSPWIELVQSINDSEEIEIELKIDAGYVRLMMDLFSYRNEATIVKYFREIPLMDSACFHKIERAYISNEMFDDYEIFELVDAFECAPKPIRRPLLSLFESSPQTDLFPMTEFIYQTLDSCLSIAEKYYSELYPRLTLRALQILKGELNYEPMWWADVYEKTKLIQRCPKI